MTIYAGLDVSDKAAHVCVVTAEGAVSRRDAVVSAPMWLREARSP